MTRCGQAVSDEPTPNFASDFVSRTVNRQDSVQLCLKLAVLLHFADGVSGRESNVRVFLNLEHIRFHPIIARGKTAVAAPCIDNDGAAGYSGCEIGSDCSVRELKFSMRGMERARQAKLDQGFRRIELKGARQRFSRRNSVREGQYYQNDYERARSR